MKEKTNNDFDVLIDIAEMNKKYLSNEIDIDAVETIEMAWDIIKIIQKNIPEVIGGFGLGFPFHSITQEGNLVVNPEFISYSDTFIDKVKNAKALGGSAWKCFQCQTNEKYHPTFCKDCTETGIKPRDVMKVLPDIDAVLIVNDFSNELLDDIQALSIRYGFHQSDLNSKETIDRVNYTLSNFGTVNAGCFPIDLHVVRKDDFIISMSELSKGNLDLTSDVFSLHYDWILNNRIDFAFDFIFSGTFNPELCDTNIMSYVDKAKKGMAKIYSENDILDIVIDRSDRAKVLLQHEPTKDVFMSKIRSWKEL